MMQWLDRIDTVFVAFIVIVGASGVVITRWSLRGLTDEERRQQKQFFAALLIYPTGGTWAAAIVFLSAAIAKGIHGDIGEFLNLLAIGVPLGVLGVALGWCMLRWPEWNK